MKYHILLGILLWTIGAALAQHSTPPAGTPPPSDAKRSAPSLKKVPTSHGKSGKPAAPMAKPEFGEENDIQEDTSEDEEGTDCEGCLLAGQSQMPIANAVVQMRALAGSNPLRLPGYGNSRETVVPFAAAGPRSKTKERLLRRSISYGSRFISVAALTYRVRIPGEPA